MATRVATRAGAKAGVNATPPAESGQMTHRQILEALTGLLAAFFTAILSSTIVSNALPTIMADLEGTATDFTWVITATLLASAATTPIWGKLSDLYNKKVLVQLSIVIFVAGSVLAGFAQDIPVLMTARVVQGIAMGGLTALAQAIIGTMIPPRERGRYSGYMGAVMAVATAGGPLLGGLIVDSPLGWRWTFFVCVPLAVIALILLQVTLKIEHIRRKVSIDWLGSILLTAGVSILLVWVSFAGKADYYAWWSWQSAAMVGGGILLLALLVLVESKVSQPIIPLKIIRERTTALAIVASMAVGVSMFGSAAFLGQYFQVARGATPTEAGLLMLPMIAGNLIGSVASGLLITHYGRWKRFLVAGSILIIGGMGMAGTIDHTTQLWLVGIYVFLLGLGLGMMLQNLVLAVQNNVGKKDVGSASAAVAFFRSFGGAIGVAVLGAVLANRVSTLATERFTEAGIPVASSGGEATLDIASLPGVAQQVMREAYGDGTALIFLIAAAIAVFALVAVLFIHEKELRRTVDIVAPSGAGPAPERNAGQEQSPASGHEPVGDRGSASGHEPMADRGSASDRASVSDHGSVPGSGAQLVSEPTPALVDATGPRQLSRMEFEREFQHVLGKGRESDGGFDAGARAASGGAASETSLRPEVMLESETAQRPEVMLQPEPAPEPVRGRREAEKEHQPDYQLIRNLQETQLALAEQQLELARAMHQLQRQAEDQRAAAAQQAALAEQLEIVHRELRDERKRQEAAAHFLATQRGKSE